VLGSSGPGADSKESSQRGCKGDLLSRSHCRTCSDRDACNAHKALCPQPWGQRVGGVSGRPTRENEEERSFHVPAVATVEGTLVHRMPVAFAGCRRNVGLGRSVSIVRGSSRAVSRTDDNRCPLEEGGGERRQRAPSARTRRGRRLKNAPRFRGHVLHSVQRPVHVNRH